MLLLDRRDEEVELLSDCRLKEHFGRVGIDDQHLYTSGRRSSAKRLALDGVQNDVCGFDGLSRLSAARGFVKAARPVHLVQAEACMSSHVRVSNKQKGRRKARKLFNVRYLDSSRCQYLVFVAAISIEDLARRAFNQEDETAFQFDEDFAKSAILGFDPPDRSF